MFDLILMKRPSGSPREPPETNRGLQPLPHILKAISQLMKHAALYAQRQKCGGRGFHFLRVCLQDGETACQGQKLIQDSLLLDLGIFEVADVLNDLVGSR